ncbi:MAG: BMP family ABC transporter substrate-binding protein [Actinobacteria bacterium]|nr:BMP family ABC transporter substrate-binding protein [Actinomycetota bacterium]
MYRSRTLLTVLLAFALLAAACGSDGGGATPTTTAAPTVTTTTAAPETTTTEAPAVTTTSEAAAVTTTTEEVAAGGCIGLVTDVGQVDDKSFNQSAWEGVQAAGEASGADVDYIETQAAKDYATNIGLFADSGCDVIVTVGFALGEATGIAAGEYPDIDFIGVDQWQPEPIANVAGLLFPEDQAGFLAGALAASLSTSGVIAEVLGTDLVPPVVAFGEGFVNGAKHIDPSITVIKTYHPGGLDVAFTDPEWGATTARQALDQGADVIFGAGGKTGNGAIIEVAGEAGAFCIGVDTDQWNTVPEAHPCLVSSSMKMITDGVVDLVGQSFAGSLPSGNYYGGVALASFHDHADSVPADVQDMLVALKADLESYAVPTCVWVTDAPGCEVPRTASWRGITEDEIHIGITMIDFPWLVELNFSEEGWGDQQMIWEALIADLNANGGINGRQVVVDGHRFYSPVPGAGIDADGVCVELTGDFETFAIIGGFLGPAEISNPCIPGIQNTVLIGGAQTTEFLEASDAPWLIGSTMKERRMDVFVSLLAQEGFLDGRSIALVGSTDGPYERAQEILAGQGVELVLDAFNDVTVGDLEAEDARWDVLVENVRTSGADTIFLVGGERAGIRNLWLAGIDIDMFVMNQETYTSLSETATPEMAHGGITLSGLTPDEIWQRDEVQACADVVKAAYPEVEIVGPLEWTVGEKWYQGISNYCNQLALFVAVTGAAGTNPTHESWLAAAEAMTEFSLPSSPFNSFGPGKYDASDAFRLASFDSALGEDGELAPMGDILDGTP